MHVSLTNFQKDKSIMFDQYDFHVIKCLTLLETFVGRICLDPTSVEIQNASMHCHLLKYAGYHEVSMYDSSWDFVIKFGNLKLKWLEYLRK